MVNFNFKNFFFKYSIEVGIFFIFFIYFFIWYLLKANTLVTNNDNFEIIIQSYKYEPIFSSYLNKIILNREIKFFLGFVLVPSLCALMLYKIFYRYLDNKLWAVSLTTLSILSSEHYPFIDFLKEILNFNFTLIVGHNLNENFEIMGYPIPSISVLYFLIIYFYTINSLTFNTNKIYILTICWLIGLHLHPVDGLIGISYWIFLFSTFVLLNKINFSFFEIIFVLVSYFLNIIYLINRLDFQTLLITTNQSISFYSLFFYFIFPIITIFIIIKFFKVDVYEFFLKFLPIYVIFFVEVLLVAISLKGYGIEIRILENRIVLFLFHFLYYVPIIYYMSKDSIYYNNFKTKYFKYFLLKTLYFVFNRFKNLYLIFFSVLLIVYGFLFLI